MTVALYTHADMLDHRPGDWHVERPLRLQAVTEALEDAADLALEVREAVPVETADLELAHSSAYVAAIERVSPFAGIVRLDPDTQMSGGTLRAARLAAGAVTGAVRSVLAGGAQRAFCAVRPPGHHAGPEFPMGFCIFSNIAVGAKVARQAGAGRIAIVDFDVHHGNGTQAVVGDDPGLFLASIQQWPHWPGSGHPSQAAPANIANAVVPPGAPRELWRQTFARLLERVDDFAPDLVMISAGFDAHARDPISEQGLEAEDFGWATRAILEVARRHAGGRVVSSLEGGYDLEALGRSAQAHVRALQGE